MTYWQLVDEHEDVIRKFSEIWRMTLEAEKVLMRIQYRYIENYKIQKVTVETDGEHYNTIKIENYSIIDFIKSTHDGGYQSYEMAMYEKWRRANVRY